MKSNPVFAGKLFPTSSSESLAVQVILYPDRLIIHCQKEDGTSETQAWDLSQLKKLENASKETVSIQYGEVSRQTLVVQSEEFVRKFKPPVSPTAKILHRFSTSGASLLLSVTGFVVGVGFLLYFWVFPWLIGLAASYVPQKYEVEMGDQMYASFIKDQKVDSTKTVFANDFLQQIDFQTSYPLQVTVVDSDIKNAFAMPGGHIVVYTALLDDIKNAKELAALLGHEAGHVTCRHSTKHIFQSFSVYLAISAYFGDLSGVSAMLVRQAGQLNQLSYSRELENEADEMGFKTLVRNKIDPEGMVDLFHTLQMGAEKVTTVPEFLSTHPDTENRLGAIQERMKLEKPIFKEHPEMDRLFSQVKRNY
jgi:Zn-dependent protease with chaperone function